MGKPSDHGVTWSFFAAAAPAPLVGLDHLAGQYGTIRLESLPGDNEAEFVEAAEGSQVGAGQRISASADGSVVHVEVFRAECVRALILRRPRPLSGHRRAGPPRDMRYTLIWEEPPYPGPIPNLRIPSPVEIDGNSYLMERRFQEESGPYFHWLSVRQQFFNIATLGSVRDASPTITVQLTKS